MQSFSNYLRRAMSCSDIRLASVLTLTQRTYLAACACKIILPILPVELMTDQRRAVVDDRSPKQQAAVDRRLETLNSLEMDSEGRLLWKGKVVQIEKRITLSFWQGLATAAVALGAASQGTLAFYQFGCALSFWVKGCPK